MKRPGTRMAGGGREYQRLIAYNSVRTVGSHSLALEGTAMNTDRAHVFWLYPPRVTASLERVDTSVDSAV